MPVLSRSNPATSRGLALASPTRRSCGVGRAGATKPCHTRVTRLRAADFITHLVAITDTALAAMQGAMQAGRA